MTFDEAHSSINDKFETGHKGISLTWSPLQQDGFSSNTVLSGRNRAHDAQSGTEINGQLVITPLEIHPNAKAADAIAADATSLVARAGAGQEQASQAGTDRNVPATEDRDLRYVFRNPALAERQTAVRAELHRLLMSEPLDQSAFNQQLRQLVGPGEIRTLQEALRGTPYQLVAHDFRVPPGPGQPGFRPDPNYNPQPETGWRPDFRQQDWQGYPVTTYSLMHNGQAAIQQLPLVDVWVNPRR